MDISILISLFNEEESIQELIHWINKVMTSSSLKDKEYEILLVDDGSTDSSWSIIRKLSDSNEHIRGIRFSRNYGKSAALHTGFQAAKGEVVITMDADLQDSPEELPSLYYMIKDENYDVVSGWKKKRFDGKLTKNIPSKIYNFTARKVTGLKLHDMNCGIKAYRNEVVKNIEIYGDMHRYIPYIAKEAGFRKIGEKVVIHQKRKYGKSKFGMDRFFNGFLDLLTLAFLMRFGKKPMHIFGIGGILFTFAGLGVSIFLIIRKIYEQVNMLNYRPVTEQPLFYLSLMAIIIGLMFFLSGFLAELISRNSAERNHYRIKDTI